MPPFLLKIAILLSILSAIKVDCLIDWNEIDALAQNFINVNQIPGLCLTLVNSSSGEVFAKGYGLSDLEATVPMQTDTRFLIASISKSFTALTVCRFLNAWFPQLGQDVLDVPIVKLAPTYNLTLIDRYRTEHATFRDLLSHRTCLNSYGLGVTAGAYTSRADRLYRYRYITEKCSFRSRFEYCNPMFILAGDILGHMAGVPFDDLIRGMLVEIGMSDSLIVTPTEDYETLGKMSRGYFRNLDGQITKMNASVYNSHSGAAAGGIISTPMDMGKYIMFHLNKGQVGGSQVIPPEVVEWLYETSNHVKFVGPKKPTPNDEIPHGIYGYGLALDLGFFDGWFTVSHEGDLSPFTSQMTFYPDMGVGIFSAINGPGFLPSESNHQQLHNDITKSFLGDSRPLGSVHFSRSSIKSHKRPIAIGDKFGHEIREKIDPALLIGVYGHPYEADIHILYDGLTLTFQYGIWGKGQLLQTDEDNVYSVQWEGDIVSIFLAYSGGPPLAAIRFDFNKPETLTYVDSDGPIEYTKDGTLETYPEIPWEEGSCIRTD